MFLIHMENITQVMNPWETIVGTEYTCIVSAFTTKHHLNTCVISIVFPRSLDAPSVGVTHRQLPGHLAVIVRWCVFIDHYYVWGRPARQCWQKDCIIGIHCWQGHRWQTVLLSLNNIVCVVWQGSTIYLYPRPSWQVTVLASVPYQSSNFLWFLRYLFPISRKRSFW